jgi:hypothetical protein
MDLLRNKFSDGWGCLYFRTECDCESKFSLIFSTVYANIFVAKIFGGGSGHRSIFSRGIIFATGSQNKPMKT